MRQSGGCNQHLDCTTSPCELLYNRFIDLGIRPQSLPHMLSCSTIRSVEIDDKECAKYLPSQSNLLLREPPDIEISSFSLGTDLHSFRSSPFVSPSTTDQQIEGLKFLMPRTDTDNLIECAGQNSFSTFQGHEINESQKPLDLESNALIWLPPSPKHDADHMENGFFQYYNENDDIDEDDMVLTSCSFDCDELPIKQNENDAKMQFKKSSVHRDFKALVFHFLNVEGIHLTNENAEHGWLEIVSSLAWQAANYVRPNTSRGGSMDPGDYIKVKCILSGSSSDSTFINGVVCSRNVKHKRMNAQHRNPKILILGGALEYQKVPDKLASINTILEQESDHLKIAFSKIEVHKPNVVLVEKSVSPYVVDFMLAKGISLVSNVKRSLLERISKCTGAHITDSLDNIPSARLGHCDAFHIHRVPEAFSSNQSNRKSNKTLMFFEGCPRRLGCTVLLRGSCLEELKKVKHAVQYASFAAYHLSLETSFLADEGAKLPEMQHSTSSIVSETLLNHDDSISGPTSTSNFEMLPATEDLRKETDSPLLTSPCGSSLNMKRNCNHDQESEVESPLFCRSFGDSFIATMNLASHEIANGNSGYGSRELHGCQDHPVDVNIDGIVEQKTSTSDGNAVSNEHMSATENSQSILVSFSKNCVLKGRTCEKPRLFRIKYYGSFDKPLGEYLSDCIFVQGPCQACNEPTDAHVMCYTHQCGNLTISVRKLSTTELPVVHEGKIWMWHRCLKCAHEDGVPPAGKRVIMSEAAWGLSFGKFLELSFLNHSSANRVASCGHSLQRDCLRFFGLGNMVACFRYSPVDILLVNLPPPTLDFTCQKQDWLQKEAVNVSSKIEILFAEAFDVLRIIEKKILDLEYEHIRMCLNDDIIDLKDLLRRKRNGYMKLLLHSRSENTSPPKVWNILALNKLRRSLLIDCYTWDHRIHDLDSLTKDRNTSCNVQSRILDSSVNSAVEGWNHSARDDKLDLSLMESSYLKDTPSTESDLSDTIDLAWTGSNQSAVAQTLSKCKADSEHSPYKKVRFPRVYSFDSALRNVERNHRLFPDLQLTSFSGTDACGHVAFTTKETIPNIRRAYSQNYSSDAQNTRFCFGQTPSFVLSASDIVGDGARLLLPETINGDIFVAVYDNEPSSIISYAISSKEHADFVVCVSDHYKGRNGNENIKIGSSGHQTRTSSQSISPGINRCEPDDMHSHLHGLHGIGEALTSLGIIPSDVKQNHLHFSFDDESSFPADKVKFSVTCYFAKQFSALRMICCPNEMDFICSLSRCRKWSARGGKSNVYFAKSLDERFIIKQVTKTELDAFEGFAPQYFNYLIESLKTGSPTCLAKVLGIYQVSIKHLKGGKEERMDLMVMENLFYGRTISRVYDLKGSLRSRYAPDTTGSDKVLLDLNLLETLHTNPIFLGSKAKRKLERAVWNDTSFLASVGVMDYSLLVGVDNKRKVLVIGIIDFMRQYTWDKQLETWVKATGILGGSKNAMPTIVSPDVYKKRFRKAMSSYFLTVPDRWHS